MNSIADKLGLSRVEMERRAAAMGLSSADDALLQKVAPSLLEHQDAFVERFYAHLQAFEETAALLGSADMVARLMQTQKTYFRSLLLAPVDWDYIEGRLRVGMTHQRIGLRPKWYIASFSLYLGQQLRHIEEATESRQEAARAICALIRRVLFDMSLGLDAYGMTNESDAVKAAVLAEHHRREHQPAGQGGSPDGAKYSHGVSIHVDAGELLQRQAFFMLDDEVKDELATHQQVLGPFTGRAIDAFHDLIRGSVIDTKQPIDETSLSRLRSASIAYWGELLQGRYDRPYTLSRVRVGMVHERLGVSLQWYLVALGVQLAELVPAAMVDAELPVSTVDALVRATMFDTSYIVDAYMEARIASLLESRGFAEHLVRTMTTGVLLVDEEGRIESANWAVLTLLGLAPESLQGVPLSEAVPGVERDMLAPFFDGRDIRELTMDQRIRGRHCRVRLMRIRSEEGDPRVGVLIDDLSSLLGLLHAREEGREHSDVAIDRLGLAAWEADAESGTLEYVSNALDNFLPHSAWSALGRKTASEILVAPSDQARFEEACGRAARGECVDLEHRIQPESDDRWVRSSIRRIPGSGGGYRLRCDVFETTESVRIRQRLDERLRYQQRAHTFVHSAVGNGQDHNTMPMLLQVLADEPFVAEASLLRRAGPHQWSVLSSSEANAQALSIELPGLGEPVDGTQTWSEGEGQRAVDSLFIPLVKDSEDELSVLIRTEPGQACSYAYREFAETMAGFAAAWTTRWFDDRGAHRKQRLQLLGTLATGVAHDLNNIITVQRLLLEALSGMTMAEGPAREPIAQLEAAAERGAVLVQDILEFATPREGADEYCELAEVLRPLMRMLRVSVPATIDLQVSDLLEAVVRMDAGHLEQIVANLVHNASQAIDTRSGHIALRSESRQLSAALPVARGSLGAGNYLVLSVEDDGPGISEVNAARVFEPFFSTRRDVGGTGLGLATAARMALQAGGGLRLLPRTDGGSGARFELWLRVAREPAVEQTVAPADPAPTGAGLRVLLAEDEGLILMAVSLALRQHGCEVTECSNGLTAIAALTEPFDVIVVDQNMPGKGGMEVLLEAAERLPNARLVICSGQTVTIPAALARRNVVVVSKPFRGSDLVAQVLGESAAP